MKRAIVDDFVIIYYSNCFACKHVLISKLMFLNVSNTTTDRLAWAITLRSNTPNWKWMRTGNCTCQRTCMECVEKKKQMTKLVLTRGHGAVPRSSTPRPRTLPDLVQVMDILEFGIEHIEGQVSQT